MEVQANLAHSRYTTINHWVVDSGASHHMTNDVQNCHSACDYTGPKEIAKADDKFIIISHTGKTFLQTHTHKFFLWNTLCESDIKINLLHVSHFCHDNNTSVEYFPSSF